MLTGAARGRAAGQRRASGRGTSLGRPGHSPSVSMLDRLDSLPNIGTKPALLLNRVYTHF